MESIWQEIKNSFKQGSYLTRLIYVNLIVFILFQLIIVVQYLFQQNHLLEMLLSYVSFPADIHYFILQPWSLITYMFLHIGFLHLLFNLLWLYWFGRVFLQNIPQKHLLSVYLLGGISGALLFMLSYQVFPVFASSLPYAEVYGASAAVMAVVFAAAFFQADRPIRIALIGEVKAKYIAIVVFFLDIINLSKGNAGGHIAHIGGALFGFYFISQYKKGKLITRSFETILNRVFTWFKPKPKMKVHYKKTGNKDYDYLNKKKVEKDDLNKILDKISKSGYSSLSKEEKERLFKHSND